MPVVSDRVTDHQQSDPGAQAEKEEPFLVFGVVRVADQERFFVEEHGHRLIKGDAVLLVVGPRLLRVPGEPQLVHTSECNYNV